MTEPPWRTAPREQFPGIPAWSAPTARMAIPSFDVCTMAGITAQWALDGADGTGINVCVVDSGIDASHPGVGPVSRSFAVAEGPDGPHVVASDAVDWVGHGTACGGVIRSVAPGASLTSVRVLTDGITGSGAALVAGLRWAIEEGFDVINLSLATTREQFVGVLHELADRAYFRRTVLVVSAHNMPLLSFPWTFSSVISVACHDEADSGLYYYNPIPPVEFHARGVRVLVPWLGGGERRATGNSFAAPHISGICARILSKHPWLTPFQLKTVLYMTARNVLAAGGADASE